MLVLCDIEILSPSGSPIILCLSTFANSDKGQPQWRVLNINKFDFSGNNLLVYITNISIVCTKREQGVVCNLLNHVEVSNDLR